MVDLSRFEPGLIKKEETKKEESKSTFSYSFLERAYGLNEDQIIKVLLETTGSTIEEFNIMVQEARKQPRIKSVKSAITYIGKKWSIHKIEQIAEKYVDIPEEDETEKPKLPSSLKDPYNEMGLCYQCGNSEMLDLSSGCCKECDKDMEIESQEKKLASETHQTYDENHEVVEQLLDNPIEEVLDVPKNEKEIIEKLDKQKSKMDRFSEQPSVEKEEWKIQEEDKDEFSLPKPIILANGSAGSGKTQFGARVGKTIFLVDLEKKFRDLRAYSEDKHIRAMKKANNPYSINPEDSFVECLAYDLDSGEPDLIQTWENIKVVINWYKDIGYKTHDGISIDVGHLVRESRIAVEENKKGRQLTQYEYRPVTGDVKPLLKGLILFCKENNRNCVIITHWAPDYLTVTNSYGYKESITTGYSPDVKPWLRDLVTWRIDFLKPEESGFPGKFIAYFDKSPKHQYQHVDITNKNLFKIIMDLERFSEEVNNYNRMLKEKQIEEKEKK